VYNVNSPRFPEVAPYMGRYLKFLAKVVHDGEQLTEAELDELLWLESKINDMLDR